MIMNRIISALMAVFAFISAFFDLGTYKYDYDFSQAGGTIGNKVSNVNVWEMGRQFYDARNAGENDIYDFVEYVQLMQCSGGSEERDLFLNPGDRTRLDDYDFSRLVENCRGIIALGAKPCLKLGNVPLKYTAKPYIGGFGVNVLPPDDYDVYYNYISALARALVEAFGAGEVLKWHFTVFTEFENADWFECETPEKTAEEFCKIYDYTVQALIDNIGTEVYVGAHAMSTTEGYWDEEIFIKHCAVGTNYKTGKTGTRINLLSGSYYENCPGETGKRNNLVETINNLRKKAEKYGLENLDYGIDEGRVLTSSQGRTSGELISRTVGYRWQAAYDARIFALCMENGIDYFSSWSFKSNGLNDGNPTLSFHIANLVSKWKNAVLIKSRRMPGGVIPGAEVKALACREGNTLRVMAYNYKNSLDYDKTANLSITFNNLPLKDGKITAKVYTVDDSCNYFDDWLRDREKYGIDSTCFDWSPDCPNIGGSLKDEKARKVYYETLEKDYAAKSKLTPTETVLEVKDGKLTISASIPGNTVIFWEITG